MAINKSLSFLEQVALALTEKSRDFIPYRQSKLTHFLKDSLGGNCCTMVLANIWVEAEQIEETVSFKIACMHGLCIFYSYASIFFLMACGGSAVT